MIFHELKAYYDRMNSDPEKSIAPQGWAWVPIPFVLVIDEQGKLLQIEDTREGDGNKKRAKAFLVPQGVKKTSGVAANLLWDNAEYVTGCTYIQGIDDQDRITKAQKRVLEKYQAFKKRIEETVLDSPKKRTCLEFLETIREVHLSQFDVWQEVFETDPVVSIRFVSDLHLYCQDPEVRKTLDDCWHTNDEEQGICLVTGEQDTPSTLHTAIKGVLGAQSVGANIVSFNLEPFLSYGKKQGENAPVGKTAMFAYTTALNFLLARGSQQKIQIGDASTVFWAEKKTQFENDFLMFFAEPTKDDPQANTKCIQSLLESPKTGEYYYENQDTGFYVLGLSPNAARLSIRFWFPGTVRLFSENIRQHFEDLKITKPEYEQPYYSLWRLLLQTAVQGKTDNILPNCSGDLMQAVLMGRPYPQSILQGVLRRVKSDSDQRVTPIRASLVKACLNRYLRNHPREGERSWKWH